jgi:glycine/sarcosine N-methyltransferase
MDFYEELAEAYDTMTQFEARFEKERRFFEGLLKAYHPRKVLDAGCGTGFHSILLAKLGLEVTGIDSSSKMLTKAEENAVNHHVKVRFHRSTFQDVTTCIGDTFDAVFCMGNSLPHLLTKAEVVLGLQNFYTLLGDGGVLVIQNLNYDRIMENTDRIVSVHKNDGNVFIRFYDFGRDTLKFNILILRDEKGGFSHKLISTDLRPIYRDELYEWLKAAGFRNVRTLGNVNGEKFSVGQSKNLIMLAEK